MHYRTKNNTASDTFIILFGLLVVALLVAGFLMKILGATGIQFSEGQRTGIVYQVSNKGIIWTTTEGQLSLQMLGRGSKGQVVNEKFYFSTSNPVVAKQLMDAGEKGEPVTLHYRQYLLRGFKYGSTGYDIVKVIEAK